MKAHSLVLDGVVDATALFVDFVPKKGKMSSNEIYPRSSETYCCGESQVVDLPESVCKVEGDALCIETLKEFIFTVAPKLSKCRILKEQACFLPQSVDGKCVIGEVKGAEGCLMATGHYCWGILNSPATGLAITELIVEGKSKSVDISPFDPNRFQF